MRRPAIAFLLENAPLPSVILSYGPVQFLATIILLLCTEQFWTYFSEVHTINDGSQRFSFEIIQQEELFQEALGNIFSLHYTYASQAFIASRDEKTYLHLRCLDLCRNGQESMIAALKEYHLNFNLPLNVHRLAWATQQAGKLFDEWCAKLIREAEKLTLDAEMIKELPPGIRKNYQAGIYKLEQFIELKIPSTRVLSKCLNWYNEWFNDLSWKGEWGGGRIYRLIYKTNIIADQLIPLCTNGQGYKAENQSLSQHFIWMGLTSGRDVIRAIQHYNEALMWDPANSQAQTLLEEIEGKNVDSDGDDEDDDDENEGDDDEDYEDYDW